MQDDLRARWRLDPDVDYLNHGSFGACPGAILDLQTELRARMERQPIDFLDRELEGMLDRVREALGSFVGADPGDMALVPNATAGVNAVLRSLPLEPGDELLVTDHEYNACRNALEHRAALSGASVVVARIPFPISSPWQAVEAVLSRVTDSTMFALIDHVTSPTALVLPVADIARGLESRGVQVMLDGAHAPGMLSLDIRNLGVAYYAGNCHKWLCSPKGAGFLWVRHDLQEHVRPLAISHGANSPRTDRSRFLIEHDWTGTCDPTPWLCVPECISFLGGLVPGGWDALRERNRDLALRARDLLCSALSIPPPCPDEMVGSMASVPLPAHAVPEAMEQELRACYQIEVPVKRPRELAASTLRVSAQAYNCLQQYERLAALLPSLMPSSSTA